ncbi:hypothetical protein MTR67_046890 [Solanum verrucosum]|uniref:Uncharacterized protein n=1 Tax=Solanum verrucosum TaxID=315347 RepID=A0AAF0UWS7_SOLVR|nr:hypothetical protein MTR67_046890 [Solanum verrucosum]
MQWFANGHFDDCWCTGYQREQNIEIKLCHDQYGSLEFLDLRETLVDKLPDEILRLQHLHHVFIYHWGSAGFSHGFKGSKEDRDHCVLASLEMVNLVNATTSIVIELGKLTRLRMLNIVKLRKKHGKGSISSCEVSDTIDLNPFVYILIPPNTDL